MLFDSSVLTNLVIWDNYTKDEKILVFNVN